jgi:hypothetical protein
MFGRCGHGPPAWTRPRKKGRPQSERPKSREETPKEGSDSTILGSQCRAAIRCGRAAQKARLIVLIAGCDGLSQQPAIFFGRLPEGRSGRIPAAQNAASVSRDAA